MTLTSICSWRWLAAAAGSAALALTAQADTGSPGSSVTKPEPKGALATAKWVTAASKHNGSGIRLSYSVPDALQAGQPARVQLRFSGVTAQGATVALRVPAGTELTADSGLAIGRVPLAVGQVTTLDLRVVPTADGLQTLDVFTSQAERSSAQSVPLKVGSGTAKPQAPGKVMTTPSGEKIISLPAQPPAK